MRCCIALGIAVVLAGGIAGCSSANLPDGSGSGEQVDAVQAAGEAVEEAVDSLTESVAIKASPDKYTWYVKNYVGMNAASVGYTSLDGMRRDAYGAGTLRVIFRTSDGSYVDYNPEAEEDSEAEEGEKHKPDNPAQDYVVTGQSLAPNTEIKYTFQVDDEGEEYDNLVDTQTQEEIVLSVAKVGTTEAAPSFTEIEPSPDKYTCYVKDYVGRNLATCGYESLAGTFNDWYGHGYIRFDITAEDGSYVDPTDSEALKSYVVTAQNVAPNTPIEMTFALDSNGEEYSNLVNTQSIESINLTVKKIK